MRNLKKFLALVLAMMMAFSLMVTANAANEQENGTNQYADKSVSEEFKEAVDVLYGMGIMTGDNGSFYGDRPVMRSEMSAVLYRLVTGDTTRLQSPIYASIAAENFTDVKESDWFAPYIGFCFDLGLVKGHNGKFNPWGNVNGYETLIMALRAMGYGKNGEYVGQFWSVNASSDGQRYGLLTDVNKSHYANTLKQNTRREVVASIIFQAAQRPQVRYELGNYNPYIGVAIGTGGNQFNPSLGEKNFGLTCHTGIVVGNAATGESGNYTTKIGFSVDPTTSDKISGDNTNWATNQVLTDAKITDVIDDQAYIYASDNDATSGSAQNVTLSFDRVTDLTMFNHKVKVWYDNRGSAATTVALGTSNGSGSVTFRDNLKTYALYDKAEAVAVVTTSEGTDTNVTTTALVALADGAPDVANNWNKTKFADGSNANWNYSFGPMKAANITKANANTGGVALSPVKNNNDTTASGHGLYLLISNTPGNVLDVVIPLDMTFTQIVQANTTTDPYSVGVLNGNGASGTAGSALSSNGYFGYGHDVGSLNDGTVGTTTTYVSLAKANLLNSPKTDLRTKVAAIEITGTAGGNVANVDMVNVGIDDGAAKTVFTDGSTYYYQLTENTLKKTFKVIKVDIANNDVYTDSTETPVIHQSVFAEATDESFIKNDVASSTSGMEGYTSTNPVTWRLQAGRDYTFTLDESGNYIYWETPENSATFAYGTYIDWETKTASSEFHYPMVYVDTNGDMQQVDLKKEDGNALNIEKYGTIILPKRDKEAGGNNSGFVAGKYIGYALSSGGAAVKVTDSDSKDTGFLQGAAADFGNGPITIDGDSVAVGAEEVVASSNMFLTENTQFYLVSGAGTANQKVAKYKGVSELMKDCESVTIDGQTAPVTGLGYINWATYTNPYEMFYYKAGPFEYDQSYAPSAQEIKTLYLPADCVTFTKGAASSLVFVGDKSATLVNANNGNWATQFTVWDSKGEASSKWIEGDYTAAGNDAYQVVTNGDNVFYKLKESGKTASDGNKIYNIVAVGDTSATLIGQYWDGTTVAVAGTTDTSAPALYKATTFNQQAAYIDNQGANPAKLYNVGSAGIKNLNTTDYPGIKDNNLSTLNGAGSLIDNAGVPVSCIKESGTSLKVTFIYVNA